MLRYLLIAMCMTLTLSQPAQANQQEVREKQCRYQWIDPGTWTAKEERLTTTCILERWPVNRSTFDRVISCESGWNRLAYNPTGPYVGLGQHVLSSWTSRVRVYSPPLWHLSLNWQNSRTMLTVTVRMVHSMGWGPWSCA